MIKGLQGGQFVNVSGGNTSVPYVNMNSGSMGNPMQGMMRINGSDMQVFDGNSWVTMSTSYATVELTGDAQALLHWAREQRDKQAQRERRIRNNPALQKAYEAIQRAESNFDILDRIVGSDADQVHAEVQTAP